MTKWVAPDGDISEAAPLPQPQVFVRTFSTPPGFPWDQARAARLEARHGAPLPIAELLHRHRRMVAWSPGGAGEFAVFYVRRSEFRGAFETSVEVDGRSVRVAFGNSDRQLKRATVLGARIAAALAGVAVLAIGGFGALSARIEAEQELSNLEEQVAGKLRLARRVEDEDARMQELGRIQQAAATPGEVLADFGWLARRRAADARIVAIHWERGAIAIESRGPKPPVEIVVGGGLVRSERPIRPGVWLWGAEPRRAAAQTAAEGGRP